MYNSASSQLKAWAKSAYARITLNRFTTAFFVFSFIYCFIQGIIQSLLYSIDSEYSHLVSGLVDAGRIPAGNITFLEGPGGHLHLQMCDDIPYGLPKYPCTTIFNSTVDSPKYGGSGIQNPTLQQVFVLDDWAKGVNITTLFDPSNTTLVRSIRVEPRNGSAVTLNEQCLRILVHPSQILLNFRREDIAWICLQFWLLAISFLAILNDSVPHTLAVLMTRALSAGWAMYAMWRGPYFQGNFQELIGDAGTPCSLDLFSDFWKQRQGYEIADLILSCTALVVFVYLSCTLLKIYNAQCFKCVGAPEHIMRINKFFMAVLACLQMEAFVLVTGMGLWIDVLMNTAIAKIAVHTPIYKALFISTCILLLPWIAMGWYSIRREMKKIMIVFLAIGFIIIAGWSVMFYSMVYRWSFVQWPYLGCFTVASFVLLIASMTLGIVCRMNFGKGLAQYLHVEQTLASVNFAPDSFALERGGNVRYSRDAKEILDDQFNSTDSVPIYFIQTMPKNGIAGTVNVVDLSTQSPGEMKEGQQDPRPF